MLTRRSSESSNDVVIIGLVSVMPYPTVISCMFIGPVLAICDGIVPINDSMASIRGPRIRKKGLGEPSGRATVGGSNIGSANNQRTTFRLTPHVALPHETTQTRRGALIGARVRAS